MSKGHQQEIYLLDFLHDSMLIFLGLDNEMAQIWGMNSHHLKVLLINNNPNVNTGVTSVAHIDNHRVCGYNPLTQPALIKYGEYNQLAAIIDTAY